MLHVKMIHSVELKRSLLGGIAESRCNVLYLSYIIIYTFIGQLNKYETDKDDQGLFDPCSG